jgi:hypothetical protein
MFLSDPDKSCHTWRKQSFNHKMSFLLYCSASPIRFLLVYNRTFAISFRFALATDFHPETSSIVSFAPLSCFLVVPPARPSATLPSLTPAAPSHSRSSPASSRDPLKPSRTLIFITFSCLSTSEQHCCKISEQKHETLSPVSGPR